MASHPICPHCNSILDFLHNRSEERPTSNHACAVGYARSLLYARHQVTSPVQEVPFVRCEICQHLVVFTKPEEKNPVLASEQVPIARNTAWSYINTGLWRLAFALLLLIGVMQLVYLLRDEITGHFPATYPFLHRIYTALGGEVAAPRTFSSLSYESAQLVTLPRPGTFELNVLLQNKSLYPKAWPYIDMRLYNDKKQVILRKILPPQAYLSLTQKKHKYLVPRHEEAIQLYFELAKLTPSDYQITLFYPDT